jgi:peptidoglycan/xylan/chitin deacetylase (PgdA/CDA1 family)
MLRETKLITLRLLRSAGIFEAVANSSWRRGRLLILCYHGISIEDEHLWRPNLYMQVQLLQKRLEMLQSLRCSVLPLSQALTQLHERDLPPRSVAITFDDGTYDFYKQAYPLLKRSGLPVTVYQTTYYSDHEMPVFNLTCSYILWKSRGKHVHWPLELEMPKTIDLTTEPGRHRVVRHLIDLSERENLTGRQKNELAQCLARALGFDYQTFSSKRILQLMNAQEVAEVGSNGVEVQLHSHRHRTPEEEGAFRREITENRERILALTGQKASHFCYPGGIYRQEFAGWLESESVLSATTCDAGLVERQSNPYLLPRFVDTSGRTEIEFESWLTGVGSLLALRRAAAQRYVPPQD